MKSLTAMKTKMLTTMKSNIYTKKLKLKSCPSWSANLSHPFLQFIALLKRRRLLMSKILVQEWTGSQLAFPPSGAIWSACVESLYHVGENHNKVFINLIVPALPTCAHKVAVSDDGICLEAWVDCLWWLLYMGFMQNNYSVDSNTHIITKLSRMSMLIIIEWMVLSSMIQKRKSYCTLLLLCW